MAKRDDDSTPQSRQHADFATMQIEPNMLDRTA